MSFADYGIDIFNYNDTWENWGGEYHTARCSYDENGLVILNGLLKFTGSVSPAMYDIIGKIDDTEAPVKRTAFNVRTNGGTARVDIYPDGYIKFISGQMPVAGWLSLAGIVYNQQSLGQY